MTARTCSVDGCDRPHRAHGYCPRHYKREIVRAGTERRNTTAIYLEDVEWMAETGETWTGAAKRLGVQPRSLERRLMRAGRQDLITTLRRRENGYAHASSSTNHQGDTAA